MTGPQARLLPDGRRLHLQHGPIDLVVEAVGPLSRMSTPGVMLRSAEGASRSTRDGGACFEMRALPAPQHDEGGGKTLPPAVREAYRAASARFATLLDELCAELSLLRREVDRTVGRFTSAVARRMHAAVLPHATDGFITPMAAVAGSVAEEVLEAMVAAAPLRRASVNNGGDIALHLAPGESFRIGLVDRPDRPSLFGTTTIRAEDGIRGVATSGWRGRSFSRGIADAVTILARTAAAADAAATVVANAVDLAGHPAVTRVPACEVQADSDLGGRLVTRDVGALAPGEVEEALRRGVAVAERLIARGLILGAALHLQGTTRVVAEDVSQSCWARVPSPLAGEGGLAQQGRMRGSTPRAGAPSSVTASRCHLLPQGEKEAARPFARSPNASELRP